MPAPDARAGRDARHVRRTGPRPVAGSQQGVAFVLQPLSHLDGWLLEARR